MKYENLIYSKEDGIGTVTMNRPHRLNALSQALRQELENLLEEMEGDDEVRVMILTGAPRPDGRPCFSAGADIKEMDELGTTVQAKTLGTPEEGLLKTLWAAGEARDMIQFAYNKLEAFPKPTIAAIDGICTAGGLELAMCCDLRLAAETAQFCDLHMRNLGILGGGGLQTWLPRLVGVAKAKELVWTGEVIDGREAWRIGLVNRVSPPQRMMEDATELALKLAANSPLAMKLSKMVINSSLSQGIYESLRFSAFCESLLRYMNPKEMTDAFQVFTQKDKK